MATVPVLDSTPVAALLLVRHCEEKVAALEAKFWELAAPGVAGPYLSKDQVAGYLTPCDATLAAVSQVSGAPPLAAWVCGVLCVYLCVWGGGGGGRVQVVGLWTSGVC